MNKIIKIIALSAALIWSQGLFATGQVEAWHWRGDDVGVQDLSRERFVIPMYDQEFRGRDRIIPLRAKIREFYGAGVLRGARLVAVKVIGKSEYGKGIVDLIVGDYIQDSATLAGFPEDFYYNDPATYDRVKLRSFDTEGRWQLWLSGHIKIKRVVVIVRNAKRRHPVRPVPPRRPVRPAPPHRPVRPIPPRRPVRPRPPHRGGSRVIDLGSRLIDKAFVRTISYHVGGKRAFGILLRAQKNDLEIREVVAVFGNGEREYLYNLEGYLSKNRTKQVFFRDGVRRLRRLEIRATSPNLIGSRGELVTQLLVPKR